MVSSCPSKPPKGVFPEVHPAPHRASTAGYQMASSVDPILLDQQLLSPTTASHFLEASHETSTLQHLALLVEDLLRSLKAVPPLESP